MPANDTIMTKVTYLIDLNQNHCCPAIGHKNIAQRKPDIAVVNYSFVLYLQERSSFSDETIFIKRGKHPIIIRKMNIPTEC